MFWLAVIVVLIVAIVIGLIATADLRGREDEPPIRRAPIAGPSLHRAEQLPLTGLHGVPVGPMNVERAHRVTQLHLDCSVQGCAAKRSAWVVLERAGHVRPAQRRPRRS